MKCPTCSAVSVVLDTRLMDDGHLTRRRHECFNEHRFNTFQVHEPVFRSAKGRQAQTRVMLQARAERARRDDRIVKMLRAGKSIREVGRLIGLAHSHVSRIGRKAAP